ncbi:MAG: anthranilate synthase component I family protein [Bacteroidota bacterium]
MIATDKKISLQTIVKKRLADTVTPITLYLKLRAHFEKPILLENNDFGQAESCFSYIGLEPIANFMVKKGVVTTTLPGGEKEEERLLNYTDVPSLFQQFINSFNVEETKVKGVINGFLGHTSFDGVQYFDTLKFDEDKRRFDTPDINYSLYRFLIAFNHFKNEMYLIENVPNVYPEQSKMDKLEKLMNNQAFNTFDFELVGEEKSNITDEEFRELVRKGKYHCKIGDVFQIVLSRQFEQRYKGDDFQVYRVLRSINPSPYLYYFDCGDYTIFGSSPEAQMLISDQVATVNPIAGTYKRTGNDEQDAQGAKDLAADPKENAEHIMLVDLARNDLGRHCKRVEVKSLKEIHFYSHVIHLVSNVQGELENATNPIQIFADTFPAGTLSGAPKYKALELIDAYENQNRSFYGGGIGLIDFNGNMVQAIVIRSFMSKDQTLYYQAGAGVVIDSVPENELQEVNNKLGALKRALVEAEKI